MTTRSRIAKLEGSTAEPDIEDWLAILDASDQAAALADLEAKYPAIFRRGPGSRTDYWSRLLPV